MLIEVWSDFSCPFCYIGKRKLEKALKSFPQKEQVKVIFKAYQLNPEAPKESELRGSEVLAHHKGISVDEASRMHQSVMILASQYGLMYDLENTYMTSTFDAHRLAKWARTYQKELALSERLMDAHFVKTLNLADHKVLLGLAQAVGLDEKEASVVLESNQFSDQVENELNEAIAFGIRGVPFFVFNRKFAISGAQPDSQFELALKKASEEAPLETRDKDDEVLYSDASTMI